MTTLRINLPTSFLDEVVFCYLFAQPLIYFPEPYTLLCCNYHEPALTFRSSFPLLNA